MSAAMVSQSVSLNRHRPVIVDDVEQFFEPARRTRRPNLYPAPMARVRLPLADLDVLDDVIAAVRQDGIEHLRQQQRIDDVAVQFDFFDVNVFSHDATV